MKSYRTMFAGTDSTTGLRDFWDAKLFAKVKKKGILTDLGTLVVRIYGICARSWCEFGYSTGSRLAAVNGCDAVVP